MSEWIDCSAALPPFPSGYMGFKEYRVLIDNPVDLRQLVTDCDQLEITALRDVYG